MVRLLIAVAVALCSGCAVTVIATEEATPVPADRTFRHAAVAEGGSVQVVVKRNPSPGGGLCATRLFLNASPVADLRIGEKVTVSLKPGRYILGAEVRPICPGQIRELIAEVADGDRRTYLIDVSHTGEFVFQETAF